MKYIEINPDYGFCSGILLLLINFSSTAIVYYAVVYVCVFVADISALIVNVFFDKIYLLLLIRFPSLIDSDGINEPYLESRILTTTFKTMDGENGG